MIKWTLIQILSLSYGRASASTSSRYLDIIMIALPLDFGILIFALTHPHFSKRPLVLSLIGGWMFATMSGLIFMTLSSAFPSVIQRASESHEQRTNVMAYLRTGDVSVLRGKPLLAIPYPNPEWLTFLLSDPTIRLALPRSIRPADVDPLGALERTKLKGKLQPIMTAIKSALIHSAPALAGLGVTIFFLTGFISWRQRQVAVAFSDQPVSEIAPFFRAP